MKMFYCPCLEELGVCNLHDESQVIMCVAQEWMQVCPWRGETSGRDASKAWQQVGQDCQLSSRTHWQWCQELLEYETKAYSKSPTTSQDAIRKYWCICRHIWSKQRPFLIWLQCTSGTSVFFSPVFLSPEFPIFTATIYSLPGNNDSESHCLWRSLYWAWYMWD